MRILITMLYFVGSISFLYSQNIEDKYQLGTSIKLVIQLNNNFISSGLDKKMAIYEPNIAFRLSGNVGIGKSWISKNLYPTINGEIQIYNSGFGSNNKLNKRKIVVDGVLAFTVNSGFEIHKNFQDASMLRYFSDFAYPSLKNPYQYSFALGTNLVFTSDKNRSFQRLGFLNLNILNAQLSYYNDGTPFQKILLGDGKDRYYTGGGTLSYDYSQKDMIGNLEISYHKFSGYNKSAFELSSAIGESQVNYGEESLQRFYNKSIIRGNLSFYKDNYGLGMTITENNSSKRDGQSYIHLVISGDSFHFVPYNRHWSFEPFIFLHNYQNK